MSSFIARIFNRDWRPSSAKSDPNYPSPESLVSYKYWNSPEFSPDQIRLLVFWENQDKKLLFDSKAIKNVQNSEHKESPSSRQSQAQQQRVIHAGPHHGFVTTTTTTSSTSSSSSTSSINNKTIHNNNTHTTNQENKYQCLRVSSDVKMLGEMIFGSVAMSYKGSGVKVHRIRSPQQLMLTKIFPAKSPPGQKMSSSCSVQRCINQQQRLSVCNDSSINTTSIEHHQHDNFQSLKPHLLASSNRSNSLFEQKQSVVIASSLPMNVPKSPSLPLFTSCYDDSSTTPNGFKRTPSPSNLTSYSAANSVSVHRRWRRNQATSMEYGIHRNSPSSTDMMGLEDPGGSSAGRIRNRSKIGLAIVITLFEDKDHANNRKFTQFFFSHFTLIECHVKRVKLTVESALSYRRSAIYIPLIMDGLRIFREAVLSLYQAARIQQPVWLNMVSHHNQYDSLCQRFIREFITTIEQLNTKSNNFFLTSLLSAVLTNHLAWVPTVSPAGVTPGVTYVNKHTSHVLDILAKTHPYNPLWAQLTDLFGALGTPVRTVQTIIVGRKPDMVCRLLYVLSYFIRCSELHECLERCQDFSESEFNAIHWYEGLTMSTEQPNLVTKLEQCCDNLPEYVVVSVRDSDQCDSTMSQTTTTAAISNAASPSVDSGAPSDPLCDSASTLCDSASTLCDSVDNAAVSVPRHPEVEFRIDPATPNTVPTISDLVAASVDLNHFSNSVDSCSTLLNLNPECDTIIRTSRESVIEDSDTDKDVVSQTLTGEAFVKYSNINNTPSESTVNREEGNDKSTPENITPHRTVTTATSPPNNRFYNSTDEQQLQYRRQQCHLMSCSGILSPEESSNDTILDENYLNDIVMDGYGAMKQADRDSLLEQDNNRKRSDTLDSCREPYLSRQSSDSGLHSNSSGQFDSGISGNEDSGPQSAGTRCVNEPITDGNRKMFVVGSYDSISSVCSSGHAAGQRQSRAGSENEDPPVANTTPHLQRGMNHSQTDSSLLCKQRHRILATTSNSAAASSRVLSYNGTGNTITVSSPTNTNSSNRQLISDDEFYEVLSMPQSESVCGSNNIHCKQYFTNFGRSLLAGYNTKYMADFVLQGTSETGFLPRLLADLQHNSKFPTTDCPIYESIAIVANIDMGTVNIYSSLNENISDPVPLPVIPAPVISDIINTLNSLYNINMPPQFCVMHLEDRLQQLYFTSETLSSILNTHGEMSERNLSHHLQCDSGDITLLQSIASTHSPDLFIPRATTEL